MAFHSLPPTPMIPMHNHDFCELFWGVTGLACHKFNGIDAKIGAGDLLLIRPGDIHGVSPTGNTKFQFFNIGFQLFRLQHINSEYKLKITDYWLNGSEDHRHRRVSRVLLDYLNTAVLDLFQNKTSSMILDRFLLNLFFEMENEINSPYNNCPVWLQEAIAKYSQPEHLYLGIAGLVKFSGYSMEYVARTLKKCTGMTLSMVVNRIKLEYAASLLATTANDTIQIADACGFESMSYFFHCFKKHFGRTPKAYRNSNQKMVLKS